MNAGTRKKVKIPAKWRFRLWILSQWFKTKEGREMLDKIKEFGAGYRTYGIVVVFLICVAAEKLLAWDVPGFEVEANWLQYVLAALGFGTMRAALPPKQP